ncbi:mitochondrial carrier domain-containing protein [Parasitella parasitica]|nr:mitochondrial carrier domain-containing protein [Parasitella parasitica]
MHHEHHSVLYMVPEFDMFAYGSDSSPMQIFQLKTRRHHGSSMSKHSTSLDGYYLFASSTAGLVARCITHPMDTIKTRLQASTAGSRYVWRNIKLSSLYRGLPVTLVFSIPALSVYLSCYEASKQVLDSKYRIQRHSVWSHLVSGCAAEVAAGLLFTPMEVMKNRMQTQPGRNSSISLAVRIIRSEGIRGFYKGYWMGLVVFVPHSMAYFASYEKMKYWCMKDSNDASLYMLCSSVAGVTGILISTPLDIIKTRWQISAAEQGQQFRQGPVSIAKHMLFKEGKGALTRGLWARIAWGIPTTAISMTIFEVLKDNKSRIMHSLAFRDGM